MSPENAGGGQQVPDLVRAVVLELPRRRQWVVDLEKEKQKLQKEQETLEGKIGGLERKLSNEGFLAKAPAAVVEKERAQLAEMKDRLAAIQQSLSEL